MSNKVEATWGIPVIVSAVMPLHPSPEEIGKRIARHVFADELRSLGRDVGPRPLELTHAYWLGDRLVCSESFAESLKVAAR
jgi:hypothetical protein